MNGNTANSLAYQRHLSIVGNVGLQRPCVCWGMFGVGIADKVTKMCSGEFSCQGLDKCNVWQGMEGSGSAICFINSIEIGREWGAGHWIEWLKTGLVVLLQMMERLM